MISYLNLKVNNNPGVLNRITNLIRKRNYNIDELNLTFGKKGYAYILVGFYTENIDIEQIKNQLEKLYDIHHIEMIKNLDRIKRSFYVYVNTLNDFKNFNLQPTKIIYIDNEIIGIYILNFSDGDKLLKKLNKKSFKYFRKNIGF